MTRAPLYDEIQEVATQYPETALGRPAGAPARAGGARRLASARGLPRGRRGARPDAGVLQGRRELLRHVPARAGRPAPGRGLHEHLVRARRRPAGARGVRARARRSTPARRPPTARSRCGRSSAPAAAAGGRSSRSTTATASRFAPATSRRSSRELRGGPIRELLLEDADTRDLTQLSEYEAVGGYDSLRKALGMERQAVLDELLAGERTRPRRRRLPDGPQGELPAEAGGDVEADLPRRQRRRVRARDVQGPRDHAPRPAPLRRGRRHRRPTRSARTSRSSTSAAST